MGALSCGRPVVGLGSTVLFGADSDLFPVSAKLLTCHCQLANQPATQPPHTSQLVSPPASQPASQQTQGETVQSQCHMPQLMNSESFGTKLQASHLTSLNAQGMQPTYSKHAQACNITHKCPATNNLRHHATNNPHMPKHNCQQHSASHRSTTFAADNPQFTTVWRPPNRNAADNAHIEQPLCVLSLSIIPRLLQVSTRVKLTTEILEGRDGWG